MTQRSTIVRPAQATFDQLVRDIRACRVCVEQPTGRPLPHEPRPVVRASPTATIAVCGQAPGTRVHASGLPFDDASGVRLRTWMDVTPDQFYDERRVAFLPMGFCFPGLDTKGGDLPPRRECAVHWREQMIAQMPNVRLMLLVGHHAQRWHLTQANAAPWRRSLSETVRDWRQFVCHGAPPILFPLPHPSWRNTGWLKANPWFDAEVLPVLRTLVREARSG